jgi:hypothetical protein
MNIKNINVSLLIYFFCCSVAMAGEETVIPLEKVPESIQTTAKELLPNASFKTANTEKEDDGTLVYEIQGTLEDGRKVEVDVLENGRIQEFEVEFTKDLVPGAVLKAIEKKLPGFEPTYIEASHSASKKVVQYEFVGELGGEKMDIEVSASGRRIEIGDQ